VQNKAGARKRFLLIDTIATSNNHTQITQNTTSASMSTLHKQHTKVDYHKLDPSMLMQNLIAKLGIACQAQDSCF